MSRSNQGMVASLLELGDATSHNLAFSHCPDVLVSYGEETITETNLLEIRRRHPSRTRLQMFTKHQEAMNGADWEWHIVGRRRTLKMRVQAKRLQCNDVLRIKHKVPSSGKQQRQILIDEALADGMKPVYCIYCTEKQRSTWKQGTPQLGFTAYQTGCLLADAQDVPLSARRLSDIEEKCIPWHFLFDRLLYARGEPTYIRAEREHRPHFLIADYALQSIPVEAADDPRGTSGSRWNPPAVDDLNDEPKRDFDQTGVHETTAEDLARVQTGTADFEELHFADLERLIEQRIPRMLAIDVRGE